MGVGREQNLISVDGAEGIQWTAPHPLHFPTALLGSWYWQGCLMACGAPKHLVFIGPFLQKKKILKIVFYDCMGIEMNIMIMQAGLYVGFFFLPILKEIKAMLWALESIMGFKHSGCYAQWRSIPVCKTGRGWIWRSRGCQDTWAPVLTPEQ